MEKVTYEVIDGVTIVYSSGTLFSFGPNHEI